MTRSNYSLLVVGALAMLGNAAGGPPPCPRAVHAASERVAVRTGLSELVVDCEQISRAELRGRLPGKLAQGLVVPLGDHLEALRRIGILDGPSVRELERAVVDFFAEQVLGYYEPEGHRMVLVGDGLDAPDGELVLLHELAHAAQEVRHGLPSRVLALADNGDAQRAASAVAEGAAVLVTSALLPDEEGVSELVVAERAAQLVSALAGGPLEVPGVPRFLVAESVFPYMVGTEAAAAALRRGGWPAVEALQAEPPVSTEQLLHPERRNDAPRAIGAGRLPPLPGWSVVYGDVLGEWGMRTWLEPALGRPAAEAAAAGWDGDRVRVARRGSAWRLDLVSAWDSRRDAREAAAALRTALPRLLDRLGPGGAEIRVRRHGRRVAAAATGRPAPR